MHTCHGCAFPVPWNEEHEVNDRFFHSYCCPGGCDRADQHEREHMKYRTRPRTAYIAGRFERRDEFIEAEKVLGEHNILSGTRWLHMEQDMRTSDDDHRKQWAMNDFADVINADFLLVFSEDLSTAGEGVVGTEKGTLWVPALWARGGRHVEFGIAIASSIDIVVIGPKENIFHWYDPRIKADTEPLIRHFATLNDFLAWYDEANILPADADVMESDETP